MEFNGKPYGLYACLMSIAVVFAADAKVTVFTGSGEWNAPERWSNGLPGSGDRADVTGASTVTADGLSVAYSTLNLGTNASDSVVWRQTGGTLTSGSLTEIGAAGAAAKMELEDVDVTLKDYRLVVGRGGNARFAMQGGTLTQNLSRSDDNRGLMTGVWAKDGVAEIVLSNVVWNVAAGNVKLGFGSIATNHLEVVGGRVDSKVPFWLGAEPKNYQDPGVGWTEMIVQDSVWTNTQAIYVPYAASNAARLLVSNSVFKAGTTVRLGNAAGTTGTVEFADCDDLTFGLGVYMGGTADSCSRLVLRNQQNAADVLTNVVYKGGARSESWVELVNSPFVPDGRWLSTEAGAFHVGTNKSYTTGVAIRDTVFNAPGDVAAAHGGKGHLVFSNATVNVFSGDLFGADDVGGGTGVVEFVDSRLTLWPDGNTEAWKSGASAPARKLYVSNSGSGCGRVRFSGGVADINSLMVPRQGYGEAVIENGADVTVSSLWVGNMTGANGILTISDTASLHVPGRVVVCNLADSKGRVEQIGGTVVVDFSRSPIEAGASDTVGSFLIGCKASGNSGYWRISGGSLIVTNKAQNCSIELGNIDGGSGTFELAGGVVLAPRFYKNSTVNGTAKVIFDGGTFKASTSSYVALINSSMSAEVRTGGAVIDTNGGDKSIQAVLAHDRRDGVPAKDGGLVKKGAGKLTVTATPTFTGDVKVEAGTLDLSGTSFALGADAAIGGGGTLIPPSGGLTVTGAFQLNPTNAPTLTVTGHVTIGEGATIAVTDPGLLDQDATYVLYTATSTSGTPTLSGFPASWTVVNDGTSLRVRHRGGTIIYVR